MPQFENKDRIAEVLREVEEKIDLLLADAGTLMFETTQARIAMGDDVIVSQSPLARLAAFQNALLDARRKLVGYHFDLAKIARAAKDMPIGCSPDCMGTPEASPSH